MIRKSAGRIVFESCNYLFLLLYLAVCILPFVHILAISFSTRGPADANIVGLVPVDFTIENYSRALQDRLLLMPFFNSIKRVILGVLCNMTITVITAYSLSKENKKFPGRRIYTWFFIFSMFFSGGLIPMYLLILNMGLMGSIWALILPSTVPIFNILVLLNFFRQLPGEIEEAAIIDGCSHFQILGRIFLPLSVPCLATLVLFCSIGHWNAWLDGLLYMRSSESYPLNTYLMVVITRLQSINTFADAQQMENLSRRSMIMAYMIISIIPIAVVYPFLQKYIKSGLVLGSVKG